jgi:hypothetical protein
VLNTVSSSAIRPRYVKNIRVDPTATTLERWNSYSQVRMGRVIRGLTQSWGRGTRARPWRTDAELYKLTIDGAAATYMQRMRGPDDVANLRDDVTNFGHHLGRRGLACIVGVGGGRDVQSAVLFGYPRVLGIELNSIFIDLLTGDYAAFAGLAGRPDVILVVDEARSYLTRTDEPGPLACPRTRSTRSRPSGCCTGSSPMMACCRSPVGTTRSRSPRRSV